MRAFTLYILKIVVAVVIMMVVLDVVYTKIHTESRVPRNKVQYLQKLQNKNFDYIFLGSSRVLNGVNEKLFTNQKVLNLGMLGQTLSETKLMLDLLYEYKITAEKILIQIDGDSGIEKESTLSTNVFIPYLDNEKVASHFKEKGYDPLLIHVPFARYMKYGHKFGIREAFMKVLNRQSSESFGFSALHESSSEEIIPYRFHQNKIPTNKQLQKLINTGNNYDMNILFFTAPYYDVGNEKIFENIKSEFNIFDYVNLIKDKSYFYDPIHVNIKGSEKLTKAIIRDLKKMQ